ncbi:MULTISPECIES: fimbrial protein [unclassified Photorhabdus]|uniref:fimbrial protein n=1 Tax=unclassified Photorhabdus TaxID=2620880 RepID=UPI000DCBC821|nr:MULTISPECIES: fimbrial protein [unclassified Photorhabdus]RAX00317.1 hypothetical protein CKY03_08030 [Photorhabdus sp. S9-53]RAX00510.1 hypothetical protein CKY05_07880 [Photorhabdus sp. S10-54]RAX04818.1 hypothetical protein CKY04_07945 [Photorhabdus sp. S8-52]
MKKQILKTSVLAAMFLGMGAAHAAGIGDSASMVVSGSVGVATCAVVIDKTDIKLDPAVKADFATAGALVKPQDFSVSLTGCTAEHDQAGNMKQNVDLQITGTQTMDGDGYFGKSGAPAGSLAVGLVAKGKTILLKQNEKVGFANTGDSFANAKKEFTVGLVAKDPNTVNAGKSVSVPLTFQLVTR